MLGLPINDSTVLYNTIDKSRLENKESKILMKKMEAWSITMSNTKEI